MQSGWHVRKHARRAECRGRFSSAAGGDSRECLQLLPHQGRPGMGDVRERAWLQVYTAEALWRVEAERADAAVAALKAARDDMEAKIKKARPA